MRDTQLVAYYTATEPISLDAARNHISVQADLPVKQVHIVSVYARISEERDGTGILRGYSTEWEFSAVVNP